MAADQWPPWPVRSVRNNLALLAELVQSIVDSREESESLEWLSRLLVVRTSGYVEQAVHEVIRGYVAGKSGGTVRTFANSWLEKSRNPSPEALESLLGRFDLHISAEFNELLEENDQLLRRDLSFLVDRRNKIAHGQNEGVGPKRALALIPSADGVVDWFVLRLNPNR
jgi:hypothetical protein